MACIITPEKIEYMKNYLKEHPIDPQYDEPEGYIVLDGNTPTFSAGCARILRHSEKTG